MYQYYAFGLKIQSELELSELEKSFFQEPDVEIYLNEFPKEGEPFLNSDVNPVIMETAFYLNCEQAARYYVKDGSAIWVLPKENASLEMVKIYLLGSCMGAVLYQRSILPLHGSCIKIGESGVLITGRSGAGKSTVSAVLRRYEGKMLTDDVAAVQLTEDECPVVTSSYPAQKLWQDAVQRAELKVHARIYNRQKDNMEKYSVKTGGDFFSGTAMLDYIFELVPDQIEEPVICEIKGADRFQLVWKNIYRRRFGVLMKREPFLFFMTTKISSHARIFQIKRPEGMHCEKMIAAMIKNEILVRVSKHPNH